MGKRIVITTIGSLGDLHPYIAIALELKLRGHEIVIATDAIYSSKVEAAGIEFYSVRPDSSLLSPKQRQEIVQLGMDRVRGTKYVICDLVLPHLRDSCEDLMKAVCGADLLITHPLTLAGPIIAQKTGIRWISSVLAPISFLSAFDPPIMPTQTKGNLRAFGPLVNGGLFWLGKLLISSWSEPVQQLRSELGLPPGKDPLFEGQHSPDLVLALFSKVFAQPQLDWPKQICVTGFPFYDYQSEAELTPELLEFFDAGSPPIVFTLGSSAVLNAGNFYTESALAAKKLGYRAVLLIGEDQRNELPQSLLSDDIAAFNYASYSKVFPRSIAVVHQGGIGTTAQVLRSGRPMLVMPYSHDQPDNAARAERLGVARTIDRASYTTEQAAIELNYLLNNPSYAKRATDIGRQIQAENGDWAACDAIEAQLNVPSRTRHN